MTHSAYFDCPGSIKECPKCGGKVTDFKKPFEDRFWRCIQCGWEPNHVLTVAGSLVETDTETSNAGTADVSQDSDLEWYQSHSS